MITALVLLGSVVAFAIFGAVALWVMSPPEYREPGSLARILGALASLGADVIDQAAVTIALHQAETREIGWHAPIRETTTVRERSS